VVDVLDERLVEELLGAASGGESAALELP